MVMLRVALANPNRVKPSNLFTLECTSASNTMDQGSRMQVHVTTYTEHKVENGRRSASPTPVDGGSHQRSDSEVKFDEAGESV